MAKKQAKPPIIGNLDEYNIVEKSRPLMLMKEVPFALGELKILDTYLSRINARDADANTVRFSKEEYEDLMGIERMHPERLSKYTASIMSKVVTLPDPFKKGKWKQYTLFEESSCDQDENGQWWIDLTCTKTAKKLFFNIDKIGYIRYQLKNVLPLTSKYSVFLYIYLLDNRFRASWTIDLQELREKVLHCNSEFYASNFKNFKQDILCKALKEVNEKTDLGFSYTPVKAGRKVTGIKFSLVRDETGLPEAELEGQCSLYDEDGLTAEERAVLAELDAPELSEREIDLQMTAEMYQRTIPECTPEQVADLATLAEQHVPFNPDYPRENGICDYLDAQCKYVRAKAPKNFYSYLRKAVISNYGKWNRK